MKSLKRTRILTSVAALPNGREPGGLSRRDFLKASAAGAVGGAMTGDVLGNLAHAAGNDERNLPDGTGRTGDGRRGRSGGPHPVGCRPGPGPFLGRRTG